MRISLLRLARVIVSVLCVGALHGCERSAEHPALRDAKLARLVPAHEFVFNRHSAGGFSFSPDGTRLAWTGPSGWRKALHVRSEATGTVNVFTAGGSAMHWSADSRRLLILGDKSGAENHHLFRLDVDDPRARPENLTPYPGVRVWLHQILRNDPEHVLVLHNRRTPTVRDLYRINLTTGAEELVAQNPGDGVVPVTDRAGKFHAWRKPIVGDRPRGKSRPPELSERSAVERRRDEVTRAVGFTRDRSQVWVLSNHNRDRVALFRANPNSGAAQLVYEDARVDIGRVLMSDQLGKPVLVTSVPDYPHNVVLDEQWASDLSELLKNYNGQRYGFDVVTMDPSEQRLVIAVYTHANRRYYLLDRKHKRHNLLGGSRPEAFRAVMPEPEAIHIPARDGLMLPAYLLRPAGTGTKPVPLVVLVHGGPWARVVWSDSDENLIRAQFFANRGYAVVVVNFRGSTGYGQAFTTAAVGEFGAKMQDDLIDAMRWAIQQGIADPQRVAIMGHSYGGYATLMALAQHPREFACGIDVAGPTDLAKLIEDFPAYWELELSHWYRYVGDPAVPADREHMNKISPVNVASRIESPLLVVQGGKDVRVPPEQSRAVVETIRKSGGRVEYLVLEDMGHALGYWTHHLAVLRASERFLADCLGGRAVRFDPLEWIARLSGRLPLWQ